MITALRTHPSFFNKLSFFFFGHVHGQPIILNIVEKTVNDRGLCSFQNSSGMPVSGFIEVLQFYHESIMTEHERKVMIQKSGVCIGSWLAPRSAT